METIIIIKMEVRPLMKVKNEIVISFDRNDKHYILLEVAPHIEVKYDDIYFDIEKNNFSSTRIPQMEDFRFDAHIKNQTVYFNIIYKSYRDHIELDLNSCKSFRDLPLFLPEKDMEYTIYLKDIFICAKNGTLDYSLQLNVKCGDIDLKIGDTVNSIKY